MRMFAAVTPPTPVREELVTRVAALRALPGADALRWTDPAGWHCTVAFFGSVDVDRLPELGRRLARLAARQRAFTLRLDGGGRFGDRALWAGLDGEVVRLGQLAEGVRAVGGRAGTPADVAHRYRPHLTLARARGSAPTPGALSPYVEELRAFHGQPWTVDRLVLLRSHPPRPGVPGEQPRYEEWDAWPLGG